MAAADAIIVREGGAAAPLEYDVPASALIVALDIAATFDGTGAAGAFVPALDILTPDGRSLGPYPLDLTIAAGASARVAWFPGLGSQAGSGNSEQQFVGALIRASAAGQNIPNNTDTDLTYASAEFDTDSMVNLASNNRILTVNTAGYYLVKCGTTWGYNNSGRRINLIFQNDYYSNPLAQSKVADSRMEPWDPFPGEGVGGSADNLCSRILHASVGDFFSSGVFQNSGATINCNSGPNPGAYLSAVLIGV